MTVRKITSMTMLISFIVLILNSVVLYIVPEGRVAYWANWSFLGLSKGQWGQQHTTVGFLFLFAGLLHAFYNWNAMVAYMKNKARAVKVFTAPFNAALALTVIFVVGTYYEVPPMSTIISISESFKNDAEKKYGNPPYGHAELSSLKTLAKKEGLDLEQGITLLKAAGFNVEGEKDIVKDIAKSSKKSPQQVWDIFKNANKSSAQAHPETKASSSEGTTSVAIPENPESGWGKKTIADICEKYNLDQAKLIAVLKVEGLDVTADQKVKEVAENNQIDPRTFLDILRKVAPIAAK